MNEWERSHVAIGEARSLAEAVRVQRAGALGPVEILEECLARIEASEPEVGAWVEIDADGARRTAARQAELPPGEARVLPLLGVPLGVKDIIDAAGLPTRAGSALRAGHHAQCDAPIVKILRDLGAIVLGKTETTQFACQDPARTRNPWNLDHSPGGSSAGSAAAVASGMCMAALGTQTGGSITRPASYCGVASFKGAWGAWPLEGIVPVSEHLDHVGPMARSVGDLALLWTLVEARLRPDRAANPTRRSEAIIAGEWFERARPPRLAIIEEYYHGMSEPSALEAFKACIARLEQAGATIERFPLPPSFVDMHASHRLVMAVEAAEVHRQDFAERPDTYRPIITRLIEKGLWRPPPSTTGPRACTSSVSRRTSPPPSTRRRDRSSRCRRPRCRARRRSPSRAPETRSSTRYGRLAGCRQSGCRHVSATTGCRSACSSARPASRSSCSGPRRGARWSWSFPEATEGPRRSIPAPVTLGRAKPCARRVRGTPGPRAGGFERRRIRLGFAERSKALDHGPYRVAVALRGERERFGGACAAMAAGPSEAGHQIQGTAVGEPLHQFPDGGGAADRGVDGWIVPHRS